MDVVDADDTLTHRLTDLDVVGGEGRAEGLEGPLLVAGMDLGETGEDDRGAGAVFSAQRGGDVTERVAVLGRVTSGGAGGDLGAAGLGPVGKRVGVGIVDEVRPDRQGRRARRERHAVPGDDEGAFIQALTQLVGSCAAVDGLVAERHLGLGFGAHDQGRADVGAFADQLGQVLIRGVLGALPEQGVDRAALVVQLAGGREVAGCGLGPAVGSLEVVDGGAHERHLRLVHDHDQRVERRTGAGGLVAPFHLGDGVFEYLGGLDDVGVGGALDQPGSDAVEHRPVAHTLEISDPELDGGVLGEPQRQGAQRGGLALVRQAGDQ